MLKEVSDSVYLPVARKKNQDRIKYTTLRPNISVMHGDDLNFDVLRNAGMDYGCKRSRWMWLIILAIGITQAYGNINGALTIAEKDAIVKYYE